MEYEPDCFDLNDWLVLNHPETYAAMRFLHWDVFCELALKIWHQHGCPNLEQTWN